MVSQRPFLCYHAIILSFSYAWKTQRKRLLIFRFFPGNTENLNRDRKLLRAESPLAMFRREAHKLFLFLKDWPCYYPSWDLTLQLCFLLWATTINLTFASVIDLFLVLASIWTLSSTDLNCWLEYLNAMCPAAGPGPFFQATHPAKPNPKAQKHALVFNIEICPRLSMGS